MVPALRLVCAQYFEDLDTQLPLWVSPKAFKIVIFLCIQDTDSFASRGQFSPL